MECNTQLDRQQLYHEQDHSDIVIITINKGVAVVSGLVSDEEHKI